jgi:hypothetical protein
MRPWRIAAVALAAAAALLPLPAPAIERFYSTGVYPPWQRMMTTLSNAAPLTLFDVLVVTVTGVWLAATLVQIARRRTGALLPILVRTTVWASVMYLVFLGGWGLNYRRMELTDRLQFDRARVSTDAARALGRAVVAGANTEYTAAHAAGWAAPGEIDPPLAAAFQSAIRELGASRDIVLGRPKTTWFDFYLRRAVVDGMTDPFFLETLVASDLKPFERPLVAAHEWAHLAGYADEGEANLVGWLACMRGSAGDRYSGWLFLYDEVRATLPRHDRDQIAAGLEQGPRDDLEAIADRIARNASPRVAAAGWQVYNQYLKANGVEAGAASYTEVVRLILGTKFNPLSGGAAPRP